MTYSIIKNLNRLPKLIEHMHRIVDRRDLYSEEDAYEYVRYIVGLMRKAGHIKTEFHGTEYLPAEGGYVMYPNHQGKYDAYSIVDAHAKPLSLVMDRERSYFVFVSELVDVLRGKRMDLQDNRQALGIIKKVSEEVAEGRRYIIFPEGAYDNQKRNTLWNFKPGCFKVATKVGAPIVPVALVDSYKVYNSWQITPVKTQVHFLPPICREEYEGMNTHQIAELVKERIGAKLAELGCR